MESLNWNDLILSKFIKKFDIDICNSQSIVIARKKKDLEFIKKPKLIYKEKSYVMTESGRKKKIKPKRGMKNVNGL